MGPLLCSFFVWQLLLLRYVILLDCTLLNAHMRNYVPQVWDTGIPVWALALSVLLPVIYVLPTGFIYAMTGQAVRSHFIIIILKQTIYHFVDLA